MDPQSKNRLIPTACPVPFDSNLPSTVTSDSKLEEESSNISPPSRKHRETIGICFETILPSCSGQSPSRAATASPLKVKTPEKMYQPLDKSRRPSPSLKSHSPSYSTGTLTDAEHIYNITDVSPNKRNPKRKLLFQEETPRKKKMKHIITEQKRTIKNKEQVLRRMKGKVKHLKELSKLDTMFDSFQFPSVHSKTTARMQCKTTHRTWINDERNLALLTFYKLPATYEFLRRQGIILPAPSTIRHWIGVSKFPPGFSKLYISQMKIKFQEYSINEKCCVLCFDEMSIAENLEYSKEMDYIEGYEDLGQLGRSMRTAKYALVFLARGLYSSWKLPIAYFLSHTGIKGKELSQLIVHTLEKLFEVNLIPKICVCDQGATNRSALSILGVNKDNPCFSIEDKVIYAIYDVPHLIKSLRNNMLNGTFIIGNKQISFNDIITVYNIDKNNEKARALLKLTDAHIIIS